MPKLGLGLKLNPQRGSTPTITLYEDGFVGWPTNESGFTTSQFYSSGSAESRTWGAGFLAAQTTGNNRHLLCHFDCLKEQYPAYYIGAQYGSDDIIYGMIYGHALFRRTGGFGNPGNAPNILQTIGTSDGHWTRYAPNPRSIGVGEKLTFSFDFTAAAPVASGANSFRFGLFDSKQNYINSDNLTLSNARYVGYAGYMVTYNSTGTTKHFSKVDTSSQALINTINNATTGLPIWGELSTGVNSNAAIVAGTKYSVTLEVTCPEASPGTLTFSSKISGNGAPSVTSTSDIPRTLSFDTFVAHTTSAGTPELKLENVKATFKGKQKNPFINRVSISGGSVTALNGVYLRGSPTSGFVRIGGGGSIYNAGDRWVLYSTSAPTGNAAENLSLDLVSGSWVSKDILFSSGITATYGYSV